MTPDSDPVDPSLDRRLGLDATITRRDFLNATLIGAGAGLLHVPPPSRRDAPDPWTGYGGVGDFASSNGNTAEVVRIAHEMRDGKYAALPRDLRDTGETFDLVVVGGGASGVGAAYTFRKHGGGSCLILDNHPMWGGEAKRNEFVVDGQRLIGPQGSNNFVLRGASDDEWLYEQWRDLGLPADESQLEHQEWAPGVEPIEICRDNYMQLVRDESDANGYFFDDPAGGPPRLVRNLFGKNLDAAPWPPELRVQFDRWRNDMRRQSPLEGPDLERWLDAMTYEEYLTGVMKLDPGVARFVDPVLASVIGLGSDVLSAYAAYQLGFPGMQGFFPQPPDRRLSSVPLRVTSFPGGNEGYHRHFVKWLIPDSISGGRGFAEVMEGRVRHGALDRPGSATRFRLGATVVAVEHEAGAGGQVAVAYVKGGKVYRVRARGVVMANGGWTTRHVVRDLPADHAEAYGDFVRAPMLVANVALRRWRALYDMGITGAWYFSGLGFSCNVRRSMVMGSYRPVLHPDKPTLLTFYIPFVSPGMPLREQAAAGRTTLLGTSYREYERQLRAQATRLFGAAGFDARRDIAGVILNRWGHAYVCPAPGFYFGRDGKPASRDVIRRPFGRIAFANSELNGHQHFVGGIREGRRAVEQLLG